MGFEPLHFLSLLEKSKKASLPASVHLFVLPPNPFDMTPAVLRAALLFVKMFGLILFSAHVWH